MGWRKPDPATVWRAVATYLSVAYEGPAATPSAVKSRLDSLRLLAAADFYDSPLFERDVAASPTKYSLRLGNRHYPHMKMVIGKSPDGKTHLLTADTHDAHCRPAPGSRDYQAFCALMKKNREVADRIEAAWETLGLPTFKAFLREDLARRKNESNMQ